MLREVASARSALVCPSRCLYALAERWKYFRFPRETDEGAATMSVDRGQLKRRSIQRRAHGSKAPRVLTSGVARRLREAMSDEEGYVVMPGPVDGTPPSVPPALGRAALRALASERPRAISPEEMYRIMTPMTSSTGWSKELTEDRRATTTDDPWEDR